MEFSFSGARRAAVAAMAALTASTAVAALAPSPAFAASPPVGTTPWAGPPTVAAGISAVTDGVQPPTIVANKANQTVADWTITVNANSFQASDYIVVQVDDANANETTDVNCNSAADFVGFHGTPTVAVTSQAPGSGVAQVTSSLSSTTACAANTKKDLLVLTFTNGSITFPQQLLTASGVAYDTGSAVAGGPVTVKAWGCAGGTAVATCMAGATYTNSGTTGITGSSNATIALSVVTANTPPTGLLPVTPGQAISNVVITEQEIAAVATGTWVCVTILGPPGSPGNSPAEDGTVGAPTWTATAVPSVAAGDAALISNGIGGPSASTVSATFVGNTDPASVAASTTPSDAFGFKVTQASSTATTFTISGLKLDTGTASGPVYLGVGTSTVSFSTACNNADTAPNAGFGLDLGAVVAGGIVGVSRIAGADRYGTAAQTLVTASQDDGVNFEALGNCGMGVPVVLARGDQFPDALAASYLAGSLTRTGILLTTPNAIPDVTLATLRQIGATDVFIVGGTTAVSQAVEDQLKATPSYMCGGSNVRVVSGKTQFIKVTRIGGPTRYDTAQMIAETPNPLNIGTADIDGDTTPNPVRTAILAKGTDFPDALAAGPMAYGGSNACHGTGGTSDQGGFGYGTNCELEPATGPEMLTNGFPLVLTDPNTLSPQAQAALLNLGIQQVLIPGGTAAVSTGIETAIQALGMTTKRFAGVDRTDTAALMATFETGTFSNLPVPGNPCNQADTSMPLTCTKPIGLFYSTHHIDVARGDLFADALVAGPHASEIDDNNPILLTVDPNTLGAKAHDYLVAHSAAKVDNTTEGPTPNGGIVTVDAFGGTAALANATLTAVQNALSGA